MFDNYYSKDEVDRVVEKRMQDLVIERFKDATKDYIKELMDNGNDGNVRAIVERILRDWLSYQLEAAGIRTVNKYDKDGYWDEKEIKLDSPLEKYLDEYVKGEDFIDSVVERINRKQLGG